MWGSLLAGGEVIVPKGNNPDTLTEDDEIHLAANMPGWLYVDTRWGKKWCDHKSLTVFKESQCLFVLRGAEIKFLTIDEKQKEFVPINPEQVYLPQIF